MPLELIADRPGHAILSEYDEPELAPGEVRVNSLFSSVKHGTKLRGFRADTLRALDYHRFSDDYIFDHEVLSSLLDQGARIGERKVRCAYDDTVQSIALGPSVRYALGVVRTIISPPPPAQ